MMKISILKKPEIWILVFALLIRVFFVLFLAKPYYGRENVQVDGDTYSFAWAFQSVYETGTYTVNPGLEYGYFGRMPGYPFFMGVFYLIAGHSWDKAFILISWIQLLVDVLSGYLLFLIAYKLAKSKRIALITLFLYAFYPFVIVWTPVVYAETLGVHLTIATLYFFVNREKKWNLMLSGISLGYGILVRPQLIFLVPVILLLLLIENYKSVILLLKYCLKFAIPVLIIYGAWPARNYINHHKIVLTQDTRGFYNWDIDVMAFWAYIYSVKSEWEPQYTQIISNQKVSWPKEAYRSKEDSLMLEKAVILAQNCGSGFSHKKGYWKEVFNTPNCNKEIESLFLKLRDNQVKYNPWNFYVKIPLANLKKALFKTKLSDSTSLVRKLASLLFYYRSLLIVIGLSFYIVAIIKKKYRNNDLLVPLLFFIALYLVLCAGTSVPLRNIEMRYFLPADVLLLLPCAYLLNIVLIRIGFSEDIR